MTSDNATILGADCLSDPGVILGYRTGRKIPFEPLRLGDHARIRSHSVIYANTTIGHHLETGHNVVIREENRIGDHFCVWNNTVIDYGCVIGNNVKIHSNCYIAQFTTIEDEVFIAPGVSVANDPHPICALCMRGPTLKKGCRIGVNVTLLPHIIIGQSALVGAGSVVTRDVPPFAVVAGNPARRLRDVNELNCPFDLTQPYVDGQDVKAREHQDMQAEEQLREQIRRQAEAQGRRPGVPGIPGGQRT
ncbi:MAG: acyltransferase [Tepidisphaeraceae bacterium]|jgi:acetyltransferase-like isoleucine patch superfamily enzyme